MIVSDARAFQSTLKMQIFDHPSSNFNLRVGQILGTLRYEDGKARTATAVEAGNFRGSRRVAKNKMLKMCIFAKDGDVKNSNLVQTVHRSNEIH